MEKQLIHSFISKPQPVCFIHYHMMKCAGVKITGAIQNSKKFFNLINDGKIDLNALAQKGLTGVIDFSLAVKVDYEISFNNLIKDAPRKAPFFYSFQGLDIPFPLPFLPEYSHFPLITCTILREPTSRFKSLIQYQFRRGTLKSKEDLLENIRTNTSTYDNYMTRYFSSIKNDEVGYDDLMSAQENLKGLDLVIPQTNGSAIDNFISCVLTAYQLPNYLCSARINISEQSDLSSDVEESFLDDLAEQYNQLDRKFYETATFKENVSEVFNQALAGRDVAWTKNLHPFTCVLESSEEKGKSLTGSFSFGWTDELHQDTLKT